MQSRPPSDGTSGSHSRIDRVRDAAIAGIFVILLALGAATALAFVVVPLFWLPYPSNLSGAVMGLAALAIVLIVLKSLCGGIVEILLVLGIVGLLVCLILPSVSAQHERRQKSSAARAWVTIVNFNA